jgi:hypothetical protein
MSNTTELRTTDGTAYVPPVREALLAEGLRCVVAGRPLPEALRPASAPFPAVATVAEGIARILAGPAARPPVA